MREPQTVVVDVGKSLNATTHRALKRAEQVVPPESRVCVHHVMPLNPGREWRVEVEPGRPAVLSAADFFAANAS